MDPNPVLKVLLIGGDFAERAGSPGRLQTFASASPAEALDLLARDRFDAVIVDSRVPPVEEEPFVSVLRRSFPQLPLLVFSKDPQAAPLARYRLQGAEAVLGPADFSSEKELAGLLAWAIGQAREREKTAIVLEEAQADLVLQRTAYLKLKESQKQALMAMHAMSECNRLLFLHENERVYLRDFCRVLVKRMGLKMAWVGFIQKDEAGTEHLVPAGHAGYERNYLVRFRLKTWERRYPKSLVKKVLTSGEPATIPDLETPAVDFFRVEEALRRGYRSVLLLPLKSRSNPRGILCLYSGEPAAFGPSEITFFTHIAGELAHGADLLRREASAGAKD
jgi:GAF domain-containing protein